MKPHTGKSALGRLLAFAFVFILAFCGAVFFRLAPELFRQPPAAVPPAFRLPSPLLLAALPVAARFDFPLGSEHGALAYNAQPFTENRHLGDDLNGIGGENSDLGQPVYAVADGRVLVAADGGPGWGNVMIVLHACAAGERRSYVQSYYGHLDTMLLEPGAVVRRGEPIATVGNADGRYWAHLHFEMRKFTTPFIGPGYREDTTGWMNPSAFIADNRGAAEDDVGRPPL